MEPVKIENYAAIETLVSMCIGTDKGSWWADTQFGSALWKFKQSGKTTESLAGDVRREIEDCLSWLITDRLADTITCETEISGKTKINWKVTITSPCGNQQIIKDVWNAV